MSHAWSPAARTSHLAAREPPERGRRAATYRRDSGPAEFRASAHVAQLKAWNGPDPKVLVAFSHSPYNNEFTGFRFDRQVADIQQGKTAALARIAELVAAEGVPRQHELHQWKTLKSLGVRQSGEQPSLAKDKLNSYNQGIDPFLMSITAGYQTPADATIQQIALTYEFSPSSTGYIQYIVQDDQTYEMHGERGQSALSDAQRAALMQGGADTESGVFKMFSSAHDTAGQEPIPELAEAGATSAAIGLEPNRPVEENLQALATRSKRLDAVTKIAGEGARWEAVRQHARTGKLSNRTRFYTWNQQDTAPDPVVLYVTFHKLWSTWRDVFQARFGIANEELADKLRTQAGWSSRDLRRSDMTDVDKEVP